MTPWSEESCGGHFREGFQTEEGEAMHPDETFCYVAAWEYTGPDEAPLLHKESLDFQYVPPVSEAISSLPSYNNQSFR